ncbi:DUF4142 domain-containing protein [Streptomyces turgidiscabies]|nr:MULTISPECIES: DUF4142 domain-containing protein [Streptomyces]MDX3492279.1 DUF4142 domain-containing protein [Streptomyces turgidiscabies]GAQ69429.1 hypothetical protein T45_01153 [Streptomyces turgidiscabies]
MRFTRRSTGTLFVGGALGLTLAALAYPAMLGVQTVSSSPTRIIAQTSAGPLTEADRDFVVKVRAAGLWEYPVGQMAIAKGTSPAVITAGQHLVSGHAALDATVRRIAPQLGITIPNLPSPQQQGFIATLTGDSKGTQFDSDFANILRITHGSIFNTVAKIRSTTENTLVRALADQANVTVLDHITVMEKTGLVNFNTVLFQETTPPKLPASDVTPPVPVPGAPTVVLTPPPDVAGYPAPSPTAG